MKESKIKQWERLQMALWLATGASSTALLIMLYQEIFKGQPLQWWEYLLPSFGFAAEALYRYWVCIATK